MIAIQKNKRYNLLPNMRTPITTLIIAFHGGGLVSKILSAMMLSVFIQPIVYYINRYVFSDWETALMILMSLLVDLFMRGYVKWRQRAFSVEPFHLFLDKVTKYGACLFIINVIQNFIIKDKTSVIAGVFNYSNVVIQATMFVSIILSIFDSMAQLGNDGFPPKWLADRLIKFKNTGDLDSDKKKERRTPNPNKAPIPTSNIKNKND